MFQRISLRMGVILLALVALASPGCAHLSGAGSGPDASGNYAGNWYAGNPDNPLGELTCVITASGEGTWDAVFAATFGGSGEYEVELAGVTEGETIVFEGSVDLGETSGGGFDWKGSIVGDVFDGSYTSKFINGTFRMGKSAEPAGS